MSLPPQHPVPRVQRHWRLVAFGQLYRGRDMIGVAMRADDREHLAVAHHVKNARRIGARIDDDDLVVVADNPDVDLVGSRTAAGGRGRRELIDPSGHPGVSFLIFLARGLSYHSHPYL